MLERRRGVVAAAAGRDHGTRPRAISTVSSVSRRCSTVVSVATSPVVPHGTSPSLPSAICRLDQVSECVLGDTSAENGVTSAGMTEKHELCVLRREFSATFGRVHWLIRSGTAKCPSMWRAALILPVLLGDRAFELGAICGAATAPRIQLYPDLRPRASVTRSRHWRRLRQSNGYSFADYARFLNSKSRQAAESRRLGAFGPKDDPSGRECHDRHRLLAGLQADHRRRLGATGRRICRHRTDSRSARRCATGVGLGRPRLQRRAEFVVTLRLQLHRG